MITARLAKAKPQRLKSFTKSEVRESPEDLAQGRSQPVMNQQNHPEISKEIPLSDILKNPRSLTDLCGKLFLFDVNSKYYSYSGILKRCCVNEESNFITLYFEPPIKHLKNIRGGTVYIQGIKTLKLLLKFCDVVVGDTKEKSFFINPSC